MGCSVAKGIKSIIEEKSLMQSAIAKKSGFTTQQFNDMLHGRKVIRAEYLPPICKAMGVSVQAVYDAGITPSQREEAV